MSPFRFGGDGFYENAIFLELYLLDSAGIPETALNDEIQSKKEPVMTHHDITATRRQDREMNLQPSSLFPKNGWGNPMRFACLIGFISAALCIPTNAVNAQNVRCVWDMLDAGTGAGIPNWVLDPIGNQFNRGLSNWNCDGDIFGFPSNNLTHNFDAVIDDGSNVFVQPLLPIAISNLDLLNGSSLTLVDGTDFLLQNTDGFGLVNATGDIFMTNAGSGFLTEMYLDGNIRFTGGGNILMTDSSSNVIRGNTAVNPSAQLILDGFTIEGAGNIGSNELRVTVNSGSLIRATGNNLLTIDPSNGANGVFNRGTLQAGGGTLRLFDGGFDNNTGTIEALSGSVVEIANASITRGTFDSSGSGVIRAIGGASLIGPITNNSRFEIPGSTVILTGSMTNTNQIAIGSASTAGSLLYDIDTNLDGGGEIIMSDHVSNQLNAVFNTTGRLTNVDNTIHGSGLLGGRITNQGTIRADQSNALIFQTQDTTNGGVNQGLMEAVNSGTMRFHISTVENTGGEIRATGGGTLLLTGSATLQNGNVNILGPSRLELSEGTVDANLTNSNLGTIATIFGGNNFISGTLNNPNGGTVLLNDDTRLKFDGNSTYNNAGTIQLDGDGPIASFAGTRLMLDGTVTLQGGGEVAMTNSVSNTIEAVTGNATADMLVNQDHRIHGSGHIGRNVLEIVNRGTIESNLPFVDNEAFGTISIDPGGGGLAGMMANEGVMRATNGGRLELLNGEYTNSSGLIEANAGSTIDLQQAVTILGGTVRTNGSGQVNVNSEVTFDGGMTLDADVMIHQPQGRLNLIGSIENRKTITVDGRSIRTSGTVSLSGGGNIILTDNPNSRFDTFPDGTPDQLINVDNTISGAGFLNFLSIVNQGTMQADGTNALIYQVPSGGFDNQGTLEITGSGGMQIIGGPFTNSGQVDIAAGSHLLRDGNYVQTGGTTTVNGTLEVTFLKTIDIQGGTLGGNGTIIGDTIVDGIVSPGNSIGILNFEDSLDVLTGIDIEISNNQVEGEFPSSLFVNTGTDASLIGFDQLNVFDNLTLEDGLVISLNLLNDFQPEVGDFYDIMTGDTITQLGTIDVQWSGSLAFEHDLLTLFDPLAGTNRDVMRLTFTAVPEPTYGACLIMLGIVLALTRKRVSPRTALA